MAEALLDFTETEDDREEVCKVCNPVLDPGPEHNGTLNHRFNFMLWEWATYRKALIKNRHGVEVDVLLTDVINGNDLNYSERKNKGAYITKASIEQIAAQRCKITYLITVKNIRSSTNVFITHAATLHSYPYFVYDDYKGKLQKGSMLELAPKAEYSFKVVFKPYTVTIGSFKIPFSVQMQTNKGEPFAIYREMVVVIRDEEEITPEVNGKSPFTNVVWQNVDTWIRSDSSTYQNYQYPIPKEYRKILRAGLRQQEDMATDQLALIQDLLNKLRPNYPTVNNYRDFFHIVLWLNEMGAELMLRKYNMQNAKMVVKHKYLELEVPGLAEKRPSLIAGDVINIRYQGDRVAYQGVIHTVNDKTIWIKGVNETLVENILEHPDWELDVSFELGRLPIERMHAGINQCVDNGMLECLFPDPALANHNQNNIYQILDDEYINNDVVRNAEQKRAVENIINRRSGKAPYIVFGPPGTGKTVTIVEAILQIKKRIKKATILVCAPVNAACDMLTQKLIPHSKRDELIRVQSNSRDWNAVPEDVRRYSNHNGKEYTKPDGAELMSYRIVVATLILSGRYSSSQKFYPDFIFIDEAAQAMEPEADVAIGLLTLGKQLVLAGDPKQLGPMCQSSVAEKYKLGVSLLERLMKTPLYMSDNPSCITMLKQNFRAHPVVLQLPNKLFYDNQLKAMNQSALNDPISKIFIYNRLSLPKRNKSAAHLDTTGQPVEFCAIFAREKREGRSPSYFNPSEVEMVVKYIKALTSMRDVRVKPAEIGVVTPYIRQMYRIKDQLKYKCLEGVEVGTTETFQGREKRVIIISTVRAQHSLLLHDKRYKLGFVKNEKRFNVALTRAMSKLIIIGCPNVLRYDRNWMEFIKFCEKRNAYFGAMMDHRTDDIRREIMNRVGRISQIDPQYRF